MSTAHKHSQSGDGHEHKPLPWDVMRDVYDFCHAQCEASYMWKKALFHYGSRPETAAVRRR